MHARLPSKYVVSLRRRKRWSWAAFLEQSPFHFKLFTATGDQKIFAMWILVDCFEQIFQCIPSGSKVGIVMHFTIRWTLRLTLKK